MLYIQIYIYIHTICCFRFFALGIYIFFNKSVVFPYIFGSFWTQRSDHLSLRTLEGIDATVTFVHPGRISMKGTVNVARSGKLKETRGRNKKQQDTVGEVG